MIQLRNVCTAFLKNGDDYLLMRRSDNRKIAPGYWYGVGGHLEPDEINQPHLACLREIFEETGIRESEIEGLQMKYIVLRRSHDEIVVNHFFFGQARTRTVIDSDEGTLSWVAEGEVLNRRFVETIRLTLVHYLDQGRQSDDVLVGVVDSEPASVIRWQPLHDWAEAI